MQLRPVLILLVFLAAIATPLSEQLLTQASAEDVVICCESVETELYLVGGSSGVLSPFTQDLGENSESATIANAVTNEESVGIWKLSSVWNGDIPASTWTLSMNYEVSNAGGAQLNATATITIGGQSYSASTEAGSSFLAQGSGSIDFDIDVDATSISSSSQIQVELTARTVVFSVPAGDAQLEFLWGSVDDDSSLMGTLPMLDLKLLEPEIEGEDVYLPLVIESPWGMDTLANSDSLVLRVNNKVVEGDPILTSNGDYPRITWTWTDAAGGEEVITVEVALAIKQGGPTYSGSTTFEIETFDTGKGTGTYYPPDEPLKTNGEGSHLDVGIDVDLGLNNGALKLERVVKLTVEDEMAFWMRWGMDHIGSEDPNLSPTLRYFNAGSVGDEERVSRFIEDVEVHEFERQMASLYTTYLDSGLGLKANELIPLDYDSISVQVDLHGEDAVTPHPISITFFTSETMANGERHDLVRNFIKVQPTPIWKEYDLTITGKTSAMSSFSSATLRESEDLSLSHSRFPWGERLSLEAEGVSQDEEFTISITPTDSPVFTPAPLLGLLVLSLFACIWIAYRMTRSRHRRWINTVTVVMVPIVLAIHYFALPPIFVGSAVAVLATVLWITALASPRRRELISEEEIRAVPTIACPACSTSNPVESDERPLRFACAGCSRVIRLVA